MNNPRCGRAIVKVWLSQSELHDIKLALEQEIFTGNIKDIIEAAYLRGDIDGL